MTRSSHARMPARPARSPEAPPYEPPYEMVSDVDRQRLLDCVYSALVRLSVDAPSRRPLLDLTRRLEGVDKQILIRRMA